jgi:hypothetical protein
MSQLHRRLILMLALSGLVRPLLSVAGIYDELGAFGHPWAPLLVTLLLALAWIAVVVLRDVARPVLTLTVAGLGYGVAAIVLNLVLHLFLDSAEWIPAPGYVAILVWNGLQGAVLGVIALGLQRLRR